MRSLWPGSRKRVLQTKCLSSLSPTGSSSHKRPYGNLGSDRTRAECGYATTIDAASINVPNAPKPAWSPRLALVPRGAVRPLQEWLIAEYDAKVKCDGEDGGVDANGARTKA